MVCGHAVYAAGDYSPEVSRLESSWFLEDYQQVKGRAETFVEHAKVGVMEAANNPKALLVFSGGKTRKSAGSLGEGTSYWEVARANRWFGKADSVAPRAFTEDFARDSLENVMFSITRFHELTGKVPRKLTVVGYEFKRDRFVDLHRAALRFPRDRFVYIGTGAAGTEERSAASEIEVRAQFKADPYGCSGSWVGNDGSGTPSTLASRTRGQIPSWRPCWRTVALNCSTGNCRGRRRKSLSGTFQAAVNVRRRRAKGMATRRRARRAPMRRLQTIPTMTSS